jgi:hypothetical protein
MKYEVEGDIINIRNETCTINFDKVTGEDLNHFLEVGTMDFVESIAIDDVNNNTGLREVGYQEKIREVYYRVNVVVKRGAQEEYSDFGSQLFINYDVMFYD